MCSPMENSSTICRISFSLGCSKSTQTPSRYSCRDIMCVGYHTRQHDEASHATLHKMELKGMYRFGRSVVTRGVSLALIAALAFGAGLVIGNSGSAAEVIMRIPLVGDGLDATPDQNVDFTDFWKAWNALEANYIITHASSTLPTTKEKLFGAIEGLAASYNDPYTVFF